MNCFGFLSVLHVWGKNEKALAGRQQVVKTAHHPRKGQSGIESTRSH